LHDRVRLEARHLTGGALAAFVVACFVVPFLPWLPWDELVRTTAWSLAVVASFVGYGGVIVRVCLPTKPVGLALRGTLGASLLCAFGGVLASVSLASRPFLIAFVVAGIALVVRDCVRSGDETARSLVVRARAMRLQPAFAVIGLFIAAGIVVQYLAGASDVSSNPYDDDISYYPFAKQLLQRGTLLDPFSFRRMSTLGGQALHHALLLTRINIRHLNVFDRSMSFLLAAGLLLSHRASGRRVPVIVRSLSVLFLIGLLNTSINSASHYSGLALFLAFFQLLDMLPREPAASVREALRRLFPFALTGAALCTLRQNYQATVGLLVVFSYAAMTLKLRHRMPLRRLLVEPLVCIGLIGLLVMPWLVLLYRSNNTFLFPLMRGTFNVDVSVTSRVITVGKFIRFFVQCWFTPEPIQTLPLFALVGLAMPDDNPRRPIASQWLAMIGSLAMLCYAFSLADTGNLARYVYGYGTAAALLTWQHAAARMRASRVIQMVPAALALVALVLPIREGAEKERKMLDAHVRDITEMLRRSVPPQAEPPVAQAYHHLQNTVPAGEPILVMLDQPYFLDFARNPILNLDMPGTASPNPGIPCFRGSDAVVEYLLARGIRYVMFVIPEHSTFLYRREIWVDHLFDPDEIWRVYAPYVADVMNNLVDVGNSRKRLAEEDNMVVVDIRTHHEVE
jgi:hypothetical protein